jgi:hypothetical protein
MVGRLLKPSYRAGPCQPGGLTFQPDRHGPALMFLFPLFNRDRRSRLYDIMVL